MSITITITADYADEVRAQMRELLGETVFNTAPIMAPQRDLPETAVVTDAAPVEPPKAEPEIVPPTRKPRAKKAETVVQPDVTDIDQNGDPVAPVLPAEFVGKSAAERYELLLPPMKAVVERAGQDAVYTVLKAAGVTNRKQAAELSDEKLAEFLVKLAAVPAAEVV